MLSIGIIGVSAQSASSNGNDLFKGLSFLEGEWSAATVGAAGGANVVGTYTFRRELKGHVLARHSSSASCKGPTDFDCDHGDLLYVFVEGPGNDLKAIYLDNEGHVIHYSVSTPTASRAEFLSDPAEPGPQFRLVYELKDKLMSGKFQMHMSATKNGDLIWSGAAPKDRLC